MELTGLLILIGTLNALYFLPSIIASSNTNDFSVMLINLFFGWTFIGWIVALIMATNGKSKNELANLIKIKNLEIHQLRKNLVSRVNLKSSSLTKYILSPELAGTI